MLRRARLGFGAWALLDLLQRDGRLAAGPAAAENPLAARRPHFDMHVVNVAFAMLLGSRLDRHTAKRQPAIEFFQLCDAFENICPYGFGTPHIVESDFRFRFHLTSSIDTSQTLNVAQALPVAPAS